MLHVFKHELRLIFREPRFWIPFIIPPMILAASQAIAVSRYGGEIMQGMESYMMLLLGCLMAPMGAPLAGDSFAGERERNSLELLQLSPIAPAKLFWGKLLAILPFPVLFALLAQLGYWFSHSEITTLEAGASMLGKTVRAATHITLFFILPLLLLVQMGHEVFLRGLMIPLVVLALSVTISIAVAVMSMRKFVSL